MKPSCPHCQHVRNETLDVYDHPSLLPVLSKDILKTKEKEQFEEVNFCQECFSLVSIQVTIEDEVNEKTYWIEKWTDEMIEYVAFALMAEDRRKEIEQRRAFLRHGTMPVYEPIDEKSYKGLKKTESSKTVIRPYVDKWYDNLEDCPNFFDEDYEWVPSYKFSYAEPIDLRYTSSTLKTPRFYRTYLVRAYEVEPMIRIEAHQPVHPALWNGLLSHIHHLSIWDEKEQKHIPIEDFPQQVSMDDLWMEVPMKEKEERLAPYKKWIRENILQKPVIKETT